MSPQATLLPMTSKVDKLPLDTEPAACNNNPSRRWKLCHQTFIVSYLNIMLCESYMQSKLVIFSLQTDSVRPWPWMESVWRKRKAFTFHRIHLMCHCIEIQANQCMDSNSCSFPYVEIMITSMMHPETLEIEWLNFCITTADSYNLSLLLSMKSTLPDVI